MKKRFPIRFSLPEFVFLILLVVSGVLLSFHSGGFVINLKEIGFSVLSTVEKQVVMVGQGALSIFTSIGKLGRLQKDYDALVKQLENYENMRRANTQIRKENEFLKEQLGFRDTLTQKNYPASIISRGSDNLYDYLTLNKGEKDGVKKSMEVIAYQNGNAGLVGRVIQVGRYTCSVVPVYNINCIISARMENTRDLGLVYGGGDPNGSLVMRYVRKRVADDLHFGDVVVTSGENENYTKNIVIGSISKISVLDYDSTLEIEVTPILDFSRLENVVIVDVGSEKED